MDSGYFTRVSRDGLTGLIPTSDEALSCLNRLGDGEEALFKMIRPRSLPLFRRWWAICQEIGQNQEPARDKESICNELKILAGFYDVLPIEGAEGYQVRTPKSISFERLTEDQWQDLFPSLEQAGRQRFGNEFFEGDRW